MLAVSQAHRILDWLDNLTEAETPPEWMWPFDDELKEWFAEVQRARDRRYGGGDRDDEDEVVPLMTNQLASGTRG